MGRVIGLDLGLDVGKSGRLIREPGCLLKFGIDFAEIHDGQVELLEFVNGEALARLRFGRSPGFADLRSPLFLEDPADFGLEAAIGVLAGDADAQHPIRAIGADPVAQSLIVFFIQLAFGRAAEKRSQQRDTFSRAAIAQAKHLLVTGLARAAEQGERVFVKFAIGLAQRVQCYDSILEFSRGSSLDGFAVAVETIDIIAANILNRLRR